MTWCCSTGRRWKPSQRCTFRPASRTVFTATGCRPRVSIAAMSRRDGPAGGEWHWLWDAYVFGMCAAAAAGVVMLDDRFPGNVPVASGVGGHRRVSYWRSAASVIRGGRIRLANTAVSRDGDRTVGRRIVGVAGCGCRGAAIYPLVFASLPLAGGARRDDVGELGTGKPRAVDLWSPLATSALWRLLLRSSG